MTGLLSRWILKRVVKSALTFEREAIRLYQGLRGKFGGARSCSEELDGSLCHLLAEEELHEKILSDASTGKLSLAELEDYMASHRYAGLADIRPLEGETKDRWEKYLIFALDQEEKTWVFYGNLGRMSKIPTVRRAFEVLASMEKEHVDILRKLLGRS